MASAIFKYKKAIEDLNPLDESVFQYDRHRWSKLNKESKKLVTSFEGEKVSRRDVIDSFKSYYQGKSDYLLPFTMTMIWGFNDTGYGTYRTNKYLETEENRAIIENALKATNHGEIEKAFKLFMKVKGLNVSYISKLLYFGTRAKEKENYALIFDIRVARALVKLLDSEGISGLLNITPSGKFKDYDSYNKLIHRWAKELEVEAENVEMFLFNGEF
jgi:hypothetical protein